MKIDSTKNVVRGSFVGILSNIINIIFPFLNRSVIIHTLGAEYVGLGSLFTSLLTVLSLAELGIGSSLVFSMYKPIAEDDNDSICALLNLYRTCYRIIGGIICIFGLCLAPFLPVFIKADCPHDINIYILYAIYLMNTGASYFLYAYKTSLLSAYQRNDISNTISLVISVIKSLLQISLLVIYKNYYLYIAVLPISVIANNLVVNWVVKKVFPDIRPKGKVPAEKIADIKKRVAGLLCHKVSNVVITSADSIIISSFIGLKMLGMYNNYYFIMTSVIAMIAIVINSMTAGVGNQMNVLTVERNYVNFENTQFTYFWLIGWCSSCFLCLYQPFMRIWVGEELCLPDFYVILFVAYFVSLKMCDIVGLYKNAAGIWWEDKFRPVISSLMNLVLNIFMIQYIGLAGVLLSTIIVSVFVNYLFGTRVLFRSYFKINVSRCFFTTLRYLVDIVAMCAVTYTVCSMLTKNDGSILTLVIRLFICIIVPNIMKYLLYIRSEKLKVVKSMCNDVVRVIRKK